MSLGYGEEPVGEISVTCAKTVWFECNLAPHETWLRSRLAAMVPKVDIDDIVQDVFMKLFATAAPAPVDNPRGLIGRVARNLVIDRYRRRVLVEFTSLEQAHDIASDEAGADRHFDSRRAIERIEAALDAMPARRRELFCLSRLREEPHPVIARDFGISISTVERQVNAALAALRAVRQEGSGESSDQSVVG